MSNHPYPVHKTPLLSSNFHFFCLYFSTRSKKKNYSSSWFFFPSLFIFQFKITERNKKMIDKTLLEKFLIFSVLWFFFYFNFFVFVDQQKKKQEDWAKKENTWIIYYFFQCKNIYISIFFALCIQFSLQDIQMNIIFGG